MINVISNAAFRPYPQLGMRMCIINQTINRILTVLNCSTTLCVAQQQHSTLSRTGMSRFYSEQAKTIKVWSREHDKYYSFSIEPHTAAGDFLNVLVCAFPFLQNDLYAVQNARQVMMMGTYDVYEAIQDGEELVMLRKGDRANEYERDADDDGGTVNAYFNCYNRAYFWHAQGRRVRRLAQRPR